MKRSLRFLSVSLFAGLALGLGNGSPTIAADAMAPAMDCSKAGAMMDASMMPGAMHDSSMPEMKPTGNTDKDYASMMLMHSAPMTKMLKMEIACGKDPKAKALAQKQLDQANADNQILHDILSNDAKI